MSITRKQKQLIYCFSRIYCFKIVDFRLTREAKTLPNGSLLCFYDFDITYLIGIYFHLLYLIFCDPHRVRHGQEKFLDMCTVQYKCLRNYLTVNKIEI